MSVVQRGEFALTESLDHGEHGCIDESDVGIGVAIAELANATMVVGLERRDAVAPASTSSNSATRTPEWRRS
jgi:hypothetical protein